MRDRIQPVARRRLADGVIDQLKTLLIERDLKPGDKLPSERELALRFGVGRPSLREALRALDALGFVSIRPGDGVYVNEPSPASSLKGFQDSLEILVQLDQKTALEILDMRLILEPQTAALAARNASEEDIAALRSVFQTMEERADDPAAYLESDMEFHRIISRSSQNKVLYLLIGSIQQLIRSTGRKFLSIPHPIDLFHSEHRKVFEAILERSEPKARDAMAAHLTHAGQVIRGLWATTQEAASGSGRNGSRREARDHEVKTG